MNDMIKILPSVALRGTVILPETIVHFDISREKSIKAIEAAMIRDQKIFLVAQKNSDIEDPKQEDLYKIGTIAFVKQIVKMPGDILRVLVEGLERGELLSFVHESEYLEAEVGRFEREEITWDSNTQEAMARTIKELFQSYCMESGKISKELAGQILEINNIRRLVDQVAVNLPLYYKDRQKLLEAVFLEDRYELLGVLLSNEIEICRIRQEFQHKVRARMDKNQKEYILREQMKLIREELGEDNTVSDADEFTQKVKELEASDEVKEKILKEIERFKSMGNSSGAESTVSRAYIETLLSLPWDKASQDSTDMKETFAILEKDHYGLEKVKERIMEYLAVRTLTKKGDAPILCLVGPPGTGKTSIARSVARALNKEYVRICLGGVRDEAEIRGHRRTYVGAMPGRIAMGIKQAGVKNPLMLLDEIDKTSSDYKGDTSSALLEVLDSEQNSRFVDHYVEIPMDLSDVLFIATANDAQVIPRPLLDRMEIIEISSYTENEKEHIAKEHLIPKQKIANGLEEKQLTIQNNALRKIISGYTKEAGVRNLEHYLGKSRYSYQMANKKDEVGIVRGLAWTSVGGDTLQIEVNLMPGKVEMRLTGQLGDVMKESAQIGISYIRSVAKKYKIDQNFFQENDIHIHIPEGAVPKDGPSAGITRATAILSAVTGIPVRADVAMTGEITLRGRVLAIGGLKEKLLAAKQAGITTVLVPEENKADIAEIQEEIKEGMELIYVKSMPEVLKVALARAK